MSSVRLAVPSELHASAEAAMVRVGAGRARVFAPEMPGEANVRQRRQRVWLERRRGAGADAAAAEAALEDDAQRAVLALLDREADAVLLPAGASGDAAWKLLEPRHGFVSCAEVWLAECQAGETVASVEWDPAVPTSLMAERLHMAAADLAVWSGRPTRVVVVNFAGGKNPERAATDRMLATLQARLPVVAVSLYSPLFYRDEGLQAAPLLQAVRRRAGDALALLCVPRLRGRELAAAVRAAGGCWAGPLLAGAEAAAARLPSLASAADMAATCEWLLRAASA